MRSRALRLRLAAAASVALLAAPGAARAGEGDSTAYTALVGTGSALCTLVYSPIKVVYAVTGLVVTSFAYVWSFGNTDVAGPLLRTTVGGDYVVTPSHLEGERDLRFTGS
jgi:hypothetical protein